MSAVLACVILKIIVPLSVMLSDALLSAIRQNVMAPKNVVPSSHLYLVFY
jgi:hypothetical protein